MMRTVVTSALRPRVYLPILLGVVLLLALLSLGNVHDVLALLGRFQPRTLMAFAAVMLAYEAIRCLQWRFLLTALDIHVPVRTQVFTYVTGEVMKSLPIGNFVPDYVLQRSQGTDFGLASSVTLAINLLEVAITLLGLVVLGVPGWSWLRPLIVFGLAGFALLVWFVWLYIRRIAFASASQSSASVHRLPVLSERLAAHPRMRRVLEELRQFREGGIQILRPRVLLPAALFSATYLVLGGLGLALLAWGLGLQQVTLPQALAVYFFSLAFATIIPLPMDLGSTELGGVGVFLALGVGVSRSAAVGVMLLDRTLALGFTLALAVAVGLVLQAEVRAELRSIMRAPVGAPAAAEPRRRTLPLRRRPGAQVPRSWAAAGSGAPRLTPGLPSMAFATCAASARAKRHHPACLNPAARIVSGSSACSTCASTTRPSTMVESPAGSSPSTAHSTQAAVSNSTGQPLSLVPICSPSSFCGLRA